MTEPQRPSRKRTKLGLSKPVELPLPPAEGDEEANQEPIAAAPHASPGGDTRDRQANKSLQMAFGAAIVVGFITAVLGYFPSLRWLGLLGPLATITLFFGFGKAKGFDGRSDTRQQFADSCYFLGFLLTMIAMLAGFLPAGMFDQEITSQGILRHFSMALGATALGLIFRILALQGARSFNQVSSEIETTLTLYARRVSSEAEQIADHLELLRSSLDQQRAKIAGTIVDEVRDAVVAAVQPIQAASASIATSLTAEAERMATVVTSIQKSLKDSAAQIANVADLRERVDKESDDALLSVEESIAEFRKAIESLGEKLSASANGITSKMDSVAGALDNASNVLPALGQAIAGLSERITTTEAALTNAQRNSEQLARRIEAAISEDGRVLNDLEQAQDRIIEQITTAGSSVAGAVRAAGDETARAQAKLIDEINEAGGSVSGSIRDAGSSFSSSISSELKTARGLAAARSSEFQSDLNQATDRLAEILRNFATKIDQASEH